MANFGFRELVVVAPYSSVWQETRSAVGAEEVVKSARAVESLPEGTADSTIVLGTTSGSRRNLDRELIPLQELPEWLQSCFSQGPRQGAPGQAALLFGSEKTGLSNEQMSYCHGLVRIPTAPRCPSMNLGQSVAVCCYDLARSGAVSMRVPTLRLHRSTPANIQSLEHIFGRAVRVLDHVGYLKPRSRSATLVKLRRVLLDLRLSNNAAKILGGILAQSNGNWAIE